MRHPRPRSIVAFERVYWSMIAAWVASTFLAVKSEWDEDWASALSLLPMPGVWIGLALILGHSAARRGGGAARTLITLFAAFSAFIFVVSLAWRPLGADPVDILSVAGLALQVVASRLLFRADADLWFAGIRPVDPEIFR